MDKTTAAEVCAQLNGVFIALNAAIIAINKGCAGDERSRFHLVIGTAIAELDVQVLEIIYQKYPELRPAGLTEIKR